MRPGRGVLGRAMMGRTAEGRSELAELADDSASSADATIQPAPRGARSMTGRQSVPLCLECGEEMAVIGQRCAQAKPSKKHHADRSHRRRPMRQRTAPRNQTGSRQSAARPTRSAGHAEHDGTCPKRKKENTGRLKEEERLKNN